MREDRGRGLGIGQQVAAFRLLTATLCFTISISDHEFRGFELEPDDLVLASYWLFSAGLLLLSFRNWYLAFRSYYPALTIDISMLLVVPNLLRYDGGGHLAAGTVLLAFVATAVAARHDYTHYARLVVTLGIASCLNAVFVLKLGPSGELRWAGFATFTLAVVTWVVRRGVRGAPVLYQPSPSDGSDTSMANVIEWVATACRASAGYLHWAETGRTGHIAIEVGRQRCHDPEVSARIVRAADQRWQSIVFDFRRGHAIALTASGSVEVWRQEDVRALCTANCSEIGVYIGVNGATGAGGVVVWGVANPDWGHLWNWELIGQIVAFQLDLASFYEHRNAADLVRHRITIARELHDSVAQSLAGASFWLRSLARDPDLDRQVKARVEEVQAAIATEHGEVRQIISALRDGSLDLSPGDLEFELQELAARLAVQWGIAVEVGRMPTQLNAPFAIAHEIKQLLREAVSNAVRHGNARKLELTMAIDEDRFTMHFTDDGTGFGLGDGVPVPQSLEERIRELGGELAVGHSHRGNRVAISIPRWRD